MNQRKRAELPPLRETGLILRLANNFNLHEQQLAKNKGFIHDLTAGNTNRKYPIDPQRTAPLVGEGGRTVQPIPSQVSAALLSLGCIWRKNGICSTIGFSK